MYASSTAALNVVGAGSSCLLGRADLESWQHVPGDWQGELLSARFDGQCRGCLRGLTDAARMRAENTAFGGNAPLNSSLHDTSGCEGWQGPRGRRFWRIQINNEELIEGRRDKFVAYSISDEVRSASSSFACSRDGEMAGLAGLVGLSVTT
jgi:hypothetical protein